MVCQVRRDEPPQPVLPPGGEVAAARAQPQPAGVQRAVRDPHRACRPGHRLQQTPGAGTSLQTGESKSVNINISTKLKCILLLSIPLTVNKCTEFRI